MNGYEKRTQKKREALIRAAQELFAQKGVAPVSVTEIAARAGVSRVTLFTYFGDKESLAREAMADWIDRLLAEYEALLLSDMPYPRKLTGLLGIRLAGREKIGEQFIQATAWDDPELLRLLGQMTSVRAMPLILRFLHEGKACGAVDPTLDDEAILAYFAAFGPVVKNPAYIKKGAAFQKSLLRLFMGGLIRNWYELEASDPELGL